MSGVLTMVLAGGEGTRLDPLTRDRAKPAVPFGGQYRLIDFALSNLANARLTRIVVLTQYKSHSLNQHISVVWRLSPLLGSYVTPVPAQMRTGPHWYAGSANAIYQNLNLIDDEEPDHVVVFGADHIYRMDPRQMLDSHLASGAGVTVAAIPMPIQAASEFGIITADTAGRIISFVEKPQHPTPMPTDPTRAFASMGNYIFSTKILREILELDAESPFSRHDIGGDLIPRLVERGEANVYDFGTNRVPGQDDRERGYWRDVGTIDSYFDASTDLVAVQPVFSLYNEEWPILTWTFPHPPAKFVHDSAERRGVATNSVISSGVIVSGGTVRGSVLSPLVRVHSYSLVEDSVLFEGVQVGSRAVVRRAIIDKGVVIPPGVVIGVDARQDQARFKVSEKGVVVIGKGDVVPG